LSREVADYCRALAQHDRAVRQYWRGHLQIRFLIMSKRGASDDQDLERSPFRIVGFEIPREGVRTNEESRFST
jgi:hypothetical protein